MRVLWLLIFSFFLTFISTGCGMSTRQVILQTSIAAANNSELLAETAQSSTNLIYKAEQNAAVDNVLRKRGTKKEAQDAVTAIRSRYEDVWTLYSKIREAHGLLVQAIHLYQEGSSNEADIFRLQTEVSKLYAQLTEFISQARARLAAYAGD